MDWSPRIAVRGRPRGWHRPMAMGMGYPGASVLAVGPTCGVGVSAVSITLGQPVTVSAGATPGSSPMATWLLAFGDGNTQSGSGLPPATTVYTYTTLGTFSVTLTVTDTNGLTGSDIGGPVAVSAAGTYDYLVQSGGSDTGITGPFATIKYAIEVATTALTGTGKVIGVRGGTYNQDVINPNARGTSWTNRILVQNYNAETVWLQPSAGSWVMYLADTAQAYIEFDGINTDGLHVDNGGVTVQSNAHHLRFRNCEIKGGMTDGVGAFTAGPMNVLLAGGTGVVGFNEFINVRVHGGGDPNDTTYGFYVQSPDNVFDDVEVYDTSSHAIHFYAEAAGATPARNVIKNSYVHDVTRAPTGYGAAGILLWGGNVSQNKIYNSIFARIGPPAGGNAIGTGSGAAATGIANCVAHGNATTGYDLPSGTTGTLINCIAYLTGTALAGGAGFTQTTNKLSGDPGFVNVGASNYRLATGSVCINAGTPVSTSIMPVPQNDIEGTARPQGVLWDQGAYERAP